MDEVWKAHIITSTGDTVLYSTIGDNQHHEGVAIILGKGIEKCLMEWKPVNTRRDLKKQFNEAKSERLNERHKQQYQESDRKVKRLARADKRVFMDDLASQAEDAASKGEHGKVYKITKVVCSKYHRPTDVPVRDKKGRLVTSETEIDTPWAEHFSEVLNRLPPTAEADVQEAEHDLDVNTALPDREEIILIIKSHKNRKAQATDRPSSFKIVQDNPRACIQDTSQTH